MVSVRSACSTATGLYLILPLPFRRIKSRLRPIVAQHRADSNRRHVSDFGKKSAISSFYVESENVPLWNSPLSKLTDCIAAQVDKNRGLIRIQRIPSCATAAEINDSLAVYSDYRTHHRTATSVVGGWTPQGPSRGRNCALRPWQEGNWRYDFVASRMRDQAIKRSSRGSAEAKTASGNKPAYATKLAVPFNLSWSNRPLHNAPDLVRTLEERQVCLRATLQR